jgi:hypothetical protein
LKSIKDVRNVIIDISMYNYQKADYVCTHTCVCLYLHTIFMTSICVKEKIDKKWRILCFFFSTVGW